MAINWTSNPLSFDSAPGVSLKSFLGPAYVPSNRFMIVQVVWVGAAANGDTFTVTDGKGITMASGKAATATLGTPFVFPVGIEVEDVQVTQISSGTVLIYLKPID
jgi:hypothetical protein